MIFKLIYAILYSHNFSLPQNATIFKPTKLTILNLPFVTYITKWITIKNLSSSFTRRLLYKVIIVNSFI